MRRAAVGRLSDVDALIAAAGDDDDGVREEARSVLRDVTIDADEAAMGETALQALGDERDLSAVARFAVLPAIRLMALARVEDEKILALIARRAEDPEIATAALARVTRLDELTTVAMKTDDKLVALAAYDRLIADTDMRADLLDQLARRARQKAVARRARAAHDTLVADVPVEEATLTRAPSLCKELESIATLDTIAEMRHRLDEVVLAWAALDETVTPELAARFAAAREGVESRLVALDAPQRESRLAAADRRATALAGRVALAERVERLLDDNPSVLAAIREEWAALGTGDPIDDAVVSRDDVDAVSRRFDAAVAACEQRREQRVAGLDHIRELETLVVELEALVPVEAPDPVAVGAGWSRLDGRWRELIAGVRRGQAAADREMAARLAALETRRNAVASRRRGTWRRGKGRAGTRSAEESDASREAVGHVRDRGNDREARARAGPTAVAHGSPDAGRAWTVAVEARPGGADQEADRGSDRAPRPGPRVARLRRLATLGKPGDPGRAVQEDGGAGRRARDGADRVGGPPLPRAHEPVA